MLGVPCNTTVRDLEALLPEYQGRGRRPKALWHSVTQWRQCLTADGWTHLTVRDGEKGPVEIEMVTRRVQTRLERKRTGPHEWLVMTRRPLSDERMLEPRATRDATDQDVRYCYRYYLTPTRGAEAELEEPSQAELARVIKADHLVGVLERLPEPGLERMPLLAVLVIGSQQREYVAADTPIGGLDARYRVRPDAGCNRNRPWLDVDLLRIALPFFVRPRDV